MNVELLNQIASTNEPPLSAQAIAAASPYRDEHDPHTLAIIRHTIESLSVHCNVVFMSRRQWDQYWDGITAQTRALFRAAMED